MTTTRCLFAVDMLSQDARSKVQQMRLQDFRYYESGYEDDEVNDTGRETSV